MTRIARLRRCCLSVPGDSNKMLDKAQTMECDQLILDLEDSVAYESKARARDNVKSHRLVRFEHARYSKKKQSHGRNVTR